MSGKVTEKLQAQTTTTNNGFRIDFTKKGLNQSMAPPTSSFNTTAPQNKDFGMVRNVSFNQQQDPPAKLISEPVYDAPANNDDEDEMLKKANMDAAEKRLQYALEGRRQRKNGNQMQILLDEF